LSYQLFIFLYLALASIHLSRKIDSALSDVIIVPVGKVLGIYIFAFL